MRTHLVAGALAGVLLASAPVEAKGVRRSTYATVVSLLAATSMAAFATGIALRFEAPNVDTLQTYKRYGDASDAMLGVGGALVIPTLAFGIIGGLSMEKGQEPRADLSSTPGGARIAPVLFAAKSGGGIAIGGVF